MQRLKSAVMAGLACAGFVSGCQSAAVPISSPTALAPIPQASPAPQACPADFAASATPLELPPPLPPAGDNSGKRGKPLQIAVSLPINRALNELNGWRTADGWSVLRLRVFSPNATSLALRFTGITLPAGSRVWLCSASGALEQQPAPGEWITPRANGEEVWMEVQVPAQASRNLQMVLSEAFAGFR